LPMGAFYVSGPDDQCMNRAIRMISGIGTPRKNSSNERMV
jgi:hypothetical protein